MIQDISHIKATRIVGGVGCGKTQQLIERVCSLLSGGEKAGNVLVLCATPQACESFTLRLNAAGEEAGVNADEIAVTTPRALALEVLSDAEAVRWSGREPRLLTAYEELFLLEDMKVSGLRPKRLREMLKFFYRSWTELADDDPNWLLPGEESNVHTLLKDNLALTRSIVEPEAGNLAVNYLRGHAGAVAAHSFAHVLVDDYQRISKASQLLAGLMATETLTIAGDRTACVQVYDSYPYAAGLDEFMDEHEGAEDIELSACHACANYLPTPPCSRSRSMQRKTSSQVRRLCWKARCPKTNSAPLRASLPKPCRPERTPPTSWLRRLTAYGAATW